MARLAVLHSAALQSRRVLFTGRDKEAYVNVEARVASEDQLVRLLQIGVVLEEVFEARAEQHYRGLSAGDREAVDDAVVDLLTEAAEESADHRRRLEALIDELDGETVAFEQVQSLVAEQYGETKPDDFDSLLYDQLHSEESAYKFYDDLIAGLENSEVSFGIPRDRLLETLRTLREEEAEGVERVTRLMQDQ
jgi:rubrerythrin